jgi:hypothetical protein
MQQGILPLQQLQGVRGAEAGGAVPHGPQHLHPHLHWRAQPRRAHPPQLARRHHPPQVPLFDGAAAAAVRRRRRLQQRVPADEPERAVHVRGTLAHDAAAHAVHVGGGRRGRAARGGHGDGRRGRAPLPQRRRRLRVADVLSLRHRRRALPGLPVGHCHRRLAGSRSSRRRKLTAKR